MEPTGFEAAFTALSNIFNSIYAMLNEITILNNSLFSILGVGFIMYTTIDLIYRKAWGGD